MSTKIHNGLRGTIEDPFELALAVRAVVEPLYHAKFKHYVEAAQAHWADKTVVELPVRDLWSVGSSYSDRLVRRYEVPKMLHRVITELHESSVWTLTPMDFAYDITLLPNATGAPPLLLVFGEQAEEYREALVATGVVERYPYWDNADPEEGVTPEEWARRSFAWAAVKDKSPSEVGLFISYPGAMQSELALRR